MAHLLGAESLHQEFPAKVVLDDVTVGISEGDRVGIVGRNGDGKSTLMKILTGMSEPDAGRVTRRRGLRVGMLTQTDELTGSDSVRHAIVGDVPDHTWRSDARIRSIVRGLAGDLDLEVAVSTLSGGQRRRVALAVLLVAEWDVIALD
ncbi:MAG: ATP-binding cassette domain-containing protein, partial [Microbacterium sp.]